MQGAKKREKSGEQRTMRKKLQDFVGDKGNPVAFFIFNLHPFGAVSPLRHFYKVNKQANNRRFLTEKKFAINK
ncbi:hypothetical protein R84B8_01115 [Treponema sp. R8-4-B8]